MGRAGIFREPLMRAPRNTWAEHPRAGGSHRGVAPANMPWEIYLACSNGETIDARIYQALHDTIDLDGLYDILEMKDILSSWKTAALFNHDQQKGN